MKVAQFRFGVSAIPRARTLLRLNQLDEPNAEAVAQATSLLETYLAADRPSEGQPAALVLAIPVSRDRRRVLREVAALIEKEFGPEDLDKGAASAKLIDNKMRERTLILAMKVLLARASVPSAKLYQVGNGTKIAPQYWTDPKSRRSAGQDTNRALMEIVVSRHLRRAYLLAENAARGRFPSLDPLPVDPGRPEFNYRMLGKQLRDYVKWGNKRVAEIKAQRARDQRRKANPSE